MVVSYLFCVEDAQKVQPLDHADARVLRRFRAWAAGEMPPGDDGLTEAVVAAGTASDDLKWVEFVQASLIIRLLVKKQNYVKIYQAVAQPVGP